MNSDSLSDTYLKAKRYLVFFSAVLILASVVGLSPSDQSSMLGWSVDNPEYSGFVLFLVVQYYAVQFALFWDAQGKQIRELAQHTIDYWLTLCIALAALWSLPAILGLQAIGVRVLGRTASPVGHDWPLLLLLALFPLVVAAIYVRGFRPQLKKSRDDAAERETDLLGVLTNHSWELVFNPIAYAQSGHQLGSKEIVFGPSGEIRIGRNINENSWRVSSGFLELLDSTGKIFSRFKYDPSVQRLFNTNDADLRSIRDQYMFPKEVLYQTSSA